MAQQAYQEVPEAVFSLHAGDMINNSDRDVEWAEWFRAQEPYTAQVPMLVTPGNHEYSGDPTTLQYRTHYTLPDNGPVSDGAADPLTVAIEEAIADHLSELTYYVDVQGVRIVSLESNLPQAVSRMIPPDAPACTTDPCPTAFDIYLDLQGEWLDRVLKENPGDWSVVTFHQPVFSASAGRDNPLVRDAWVPIFEENDVDLVLMGHDHAYTRGHLAANETATPGLTTGPAYVVSVSGPKYYELAPVDDNVWTRNGAVPVTRAAQTSGYQRIEIEGDTLTYQAVVAAKGPGSTVAAAVGEVYDEFTVTKGADGAKWVTEPGVEVPGDEVLGSIVGRVLDPTGAPVGGALVSAMAPEDRWVGVANVFTDDDGTYVLDDVPAGTYGVRFVAPPERGLPIQWWQDATIRSEATAVIVDSTTPISAIDPTLAAPASISGVITDVDGVAVPGARVAAFTELGAWFPTATTIADAQGRYELSNLTAGTYSIRFVPEGESLVAAWHLDDDGSIARIAVAVGASITGVDAGLAPAYEILGSVTTTDGDAVPGVTVRAFRPTDTWVASATAVTDQDGNYRIVGLAEGQYQLRFDPPTGDGLLQRWFEGAANRGSVTPVTLDADDPSAVVDEVLTSDGASGPPVAPPA